METPENSLAPSEVARNNTNDGPRSSPSRKRAPSSASRSRRETIILLFLTVFILNSIDGQQMMKSLKGQMGGLLQTEAEQNSTNHVKNLTEDTAVIITSSWIPSHPSTYMVDMVVNSTIDRLIGLSPTAPIFITVDHFRARGADAPDVQEKIEKLEGYTSNLFSTYLTNPRIHVIPGAKRLHIGGSVMKALNLIGVHFPSVRYVYYLQHDFYFTRDVDHKALVNTMDEHDEINYVRFPKRAPHAISRVCGDRKPIQYNRTIFAPHELTGNGTVPTLTLHPTSAYSDNNHLVRYTWYKDIIASLIYLERAPEDPLQRRANDGCFGGRDIGLYLYNQQNIAHLDGRHTAGRK